ncbi:unnamed protein product, partial [Rotaria sp. Silwood2]
MSKDNDNDKDKDEGESSSTAIATNAALANVQSTERGIQEENKQTKRNKHV